MSPNEDSCVPPIIDMDRWRNVATEASNWEERYRKICLHIPEQSSVVEFGCGNEGIRKFLPASCRYQPTDVIKRSPDCIVIDLNSKSLPLIDMYFDFSVFAGVLEYIQQPLVTIANSLETCGTTIFSYAALDSFPDKFERESRHGWQNHLTKKDIVDFLVGEQFVIAEIEQWKKQNIWAVKKRKTTL